MMSGDNYSEGSTRLLILAISLLSGCSELTVSEVPIGNLAQSITNVFGPAACEEQGSTPAERKLCEQAAVFNKTVWQGALTGSLLAIAYTLVSGGDTDEALQNAALGAAVGALAGAYVANKQDEFTNQEDILNSMIDDVRLKNQEAQNMIKSMQAVVADDQRRMVELDTRYKQQLLTREQLDRELTSVNKNREEVMAITKKATEQLLVFTASKKEYETKYPSASTTAYSEEIQRLQNNIETMRQISSRLGYAKLG